MCKVIYIPPMHIKIQGSVFSRIKNQKIGIELWKAESVQVTADELFFILLPHCGNYVFVKKKFRDISVRVLRIV